MKAVLQAISKSLAQRLKLRFTTKTVPAHIHVVKSWSSNNEIRIQFEVQIDPKDLRVVVLQEMAKITNPEVKVTATNIVKDQILLKFSEVRKPNDTKATS